MTISDIKFRRAMAQSSVGRFPGSATAMLDRIPVSVQRALPSAQIAALMDAMWDACQEAKSIAMRDAVSEGAIWDAARCDMREVA